MKTDIHLLIDITFYLKKLLNIDYSKMTISSSSGMSCKSLNSEILTEFLFKTKF